MVLPKRRSARALFTEELAGSSRPTPQDCALEVAVVWGDAVLEAGLFAAGPVRLGGRRGDLQLHVGDGQLHLLAVVDGPRAFLTAPDGGSIELSREGGPPVPAGGAATLGLHDRARVLVGALTLVCRFVRPPLHAAGGLGRQLDLYFSRSLAVSLLGHLAALAVLIVTPRPESLLDPTFQLLPPHPVAAVTERPVVKRPDFHVPRELATAPSFRSNQAATPEQKRKQALSSGLLTGLDSPVARELFGGSGLGTGVSAALERLGTGSSGPLEAGISGLGSRPGSGGTGPGGMSIGVLTGRGGRPRSPSLGRPGGEHERVQVAPCGGGVCKDAGDGLGKEVIGEVIRRHQNQIRYCFETELQQHPDLGGKVAVQFVIDGSGQVVEATVQLDSVGAAVSGCMLERIRRWRFPEPKGGGQVLVTYPWILRSAGSGE